jgi:hypothetical protein
VTSAPSLATLRVLRTNLKRQRVVIEQHRITIDAQLRHIAALRTDLDLLTTSLSRTQPEHGDGRNSRRSFTPALLSPPGQLRRIPPVRAPDADKPMLGLDNGLKARGKRRR